MSISVRGCLYGIKEFTVCFTKKNEDKIRGSITASTLSAKIYCVSCNDPFLKRWKELYVYGWNIRSEWIGS
jgi:hypothetical protein